MIGKENDSKPLSINDYTKQASASHISQGVSKSNKLVQNHGSFSSQKTFNSKLSPHIHDEESLKRIINRLSRIEGHVRGIKTMVRENRPCPEVLNQVAAVKGAISGVAKIILEEHLEECLVRAANQGNLEAEIKELKNALNLFTS